MAHFEIEIKSLLGEKAAADALKAHLQALDTSCAFVSQNTQRNHYFEGGDVEALYEKTKHFFSDEQVQKFQTILKRGSEFSVRTRQKDIEVLLVIKASLDEGTSANTVSRMEFEEAVAVSLEALDALLLASGFHYQAKWSRQREEYAYKGINVCIDKNAGYGYLAEFEKITDDESSLPVVRAELEALMTELGVVELPQDRLTRMFDFYNQHWAEYYGTDRTFHVA